MVTQREPSKVEWMYLSLATLLLALVSAQSWGAIGGQGSPSVIAPFGFPLAIPAIMFQSAVGPALLAAISFLAAETLLLTRGVFMKATLRATLVIGALSASDFALEWKDGIRWEGHHFTVTTAILSAAFFTLLLLLIFGFPRLKSNASQLLVHFVLAAWLVTYAFPWLGETL